jgi:hypothetical protein
MECLARGARIVARGSEEATGGRFVVALDICGLALLE